MSEIYQFHQLVDLVRRMRKPVEMSDDSLIALDDEISATEALAAKRKELLRESEEAIKELLPVVQYILENGWDEAPPLFGTKFDETKANILGLNVLVKLAEELADD